jgi:hypothetical protein
MERFHCGGLTFAPLDGKASWDGDWPEAEAPPSGSAAGTSGTGAVKALEGAVAKEGSAGMVADALWADEEPGEEIGAWVWAWIKGVDAKQARTTRAKQRFN